MEFYNNLKKYILTMEDLEEQGFPRPDPRQKGKAIVLKVSFFSMISYQVKRKLKIFLCFLLLPLNAKSILYVV